MPQANKVNRPHDEVPGPAERARLVARLRALGLKANEAAAMVVAGRTRRQMVGDLRDWLRDRPKGKA